MENLAVVTGTTSDIAEQLVKNYNIKVVPFYIGFSGKLYLEQIEIISKEVYEKNLEVGVKIHTSTSSVGDFVEVYRDLIEKEKKTLKKMDSFMLLVLA